MIALQHQRTKTKTTKGRQKIPIKRLQDENSRQVTFSKRRDGLFKKASELCILTGARIAIITFSPNVRRPFYFSHPEIDGILEKYMRQGHGSSSGDKKVFQEQEERIAQLCWKPKQQCESARQQLEEEQRRSTTLLEEKEAREGRGAFWWDEACVERMDDLEELEEFTKALTDLRNNLSARCNELMMGVSSTPIGDGFGIGDQCGCGTHAGCSNATSSSGLGSGADAYDGRGFDHVGMSFSVGEVRNWNFGAE